MLCDRVGVVLSVLRSFLLILPNVTLERYETYLWLSEVLDWLNYLLYRFKIQDLGCNWCLMIASTFTLLNMYCNRLSKSVSRFFFKKKSFIWPCLRRYFTSFSLHFMHNPFSVGNNSVLLYFSVVVNLLLN